MHLPTLLQLPIWHQPTNTTHNLFAQYRWLCNQYRWSSFHWSEEVPNPGNWGGTGIFKEALQRNIFVLIMLSQWQFMQILILTGFFGTIIITFFCCTYNSWYYWSWNAIILMLKHAGDSIQGTNELAIILWIPQIKVAFQATHLGHECYFFSFKYIYTPSLMST